MKTCELCSEELAEGFTSKYEGARLHIKAFGTFQGLDMDYTLCHRCTRMVRKRIFEIREEFLKGIHDGPCEKCEHYNEPQCTFESRKSCPFGKVVELEAEK